MKPNLLKDKKFNFINTFEVKGLKDGDEELQDIVIRGLASTSSVDRVHDVIDQGAWEKSGGLDNYKKNPIVLFNHDYDEPIGVVTEIEVTSKGLEVEARISPAAGKVYHLIKEGILKTFSVGFMVKEWDYNEKTQTFVILDAELFELSVVSVPCNQDAVFSVAKSLSESELREFINVSKAKVNASSSESLEASQEAPIKEILMTPEEIKLQAEMAAKAAVEAYKKEQEEIAAKAAREAAAKKELEETVNVIVKSGAEDLLADLKKDLEDKNANLAATLEAYKKELEEKAAELQAMATSKRNFSDRKKGDLTEFGREFLEAKLLAVVLKSGMAETKFGQALLEKAGVNYTTNAADIDQTVSRQIEKEVRLELRAANLFREIPVISGATVLPIQPDSAKAVWQALGAPNGNLSEYGKSDNVFPVKQVILNAYRLISSTYLDNDVDEQVLVNLLPMLVDAVVRAHARAIDDAIINGNGTITGLAGYATAAAGTLDISDNTKLTASLLHESRRGMGKYGLRTADLAYIVSQNGYYDLTQDSEFKDITDVGSDLALKVTGTVGSVYGVPVIVSDSFPAPVASGPAAFVVNTKNYVIPRLRGISIEQDYEVGNQRKIIVASQSLGFEELVDGYTNNQPSIRINYVA